MVSRKEIIDSVKGYLEYQMSIGIEYVNEKSANERASEVSTKNNLLTDKENVSKCTRCGLSESRTNAVFGEGDIQADLMFVGEGPGRDEDIQGRPFVGRAGQLLTRIIKAMGFERQQVYIANIIKCRPPQNRNPLPDEIRNCYPYLLRQIEYIKPKVICALGTFAAQTLLETDERITRLRGRFHDFHGIKFMPTFHPAYLLRNMSYKEEVWEDVQKIMEYLKHTD